MYPNASDSWECQGLPSVRLGNREAFLIVSAESTKLLPDDWPETCPTETPSS